MNYREPDVANSFSANCFSALSRMFALIAQTVSGIRVYKCMDYVSTVLKEKILFLTLSRIIARVLNHWTFANIGPK